MAKRLIEDGQPMSERTMYRRRRAAGLTQSVFRYPFNESFFERWSDELAWVLGLIWSDGCLYGNSVEICSADFDLMQLVEGLIEMPNGVRPKNKGRHYRIVFTSKKVIQWLRQLGLTEAKSLTANFPEIPREFIGAFLRGLLDGDGSVLERDMRDGQQVTDISVCWYSASPLLTKGLVDCIESFSIRCNTRKASETVFRVSIHAQESLKTLFHLMYPSEDVSCLLRKRVPFQVWVETPRPKLGRPKN